MKEASAQAYKWSFADAGHKDLGWDNDFPLYRCGTYLGAPGLAAWGVGFLASYPTATVVCGVGSGIPFLLGVALTPVDAIVTLIEGLSYKEIAARKFKKLIDGENSRANEKQFNFLISEISKL